MTIKNQETKDLWTKVIPNYSFIVLWLIFLWVGLYQNMQETKIIHHKVDEISDTIKISSTTWTTTDTLTWDVITWDQDITIESATDPRSYLDYLLENGEAGKDYIVAVPTNQPAMNAKSWAENNTTMHNYLHKNRISFDLPKNGKQAYIMLVTSKPLSKIGNLFIGIDWKTVWWIDKYAKIPTDAVNEYLYPLCNFQLIGNGWKKFPAKNLCKEDVHNNKISLNAVVGGGNNKVEKIIIFFK